MPDHGRSARSAASTCFHYVYRDAGNFKSRGTVILSGRLSLSERELIERKMESGEFFIAEQIGVPPLYAALYQYSGGMTREDHVWHSFEEFEDCREGGQVDEASCWGTCDDFVRRFEQVASWDLTLSPHAGLT